MIALLNYLCGLVILVALRFNNLNTGVAHSITVSGSGLQDSTGAVLPTACAKSTVMLTV